VRCGAETSGCLIGARVLQAIGGSAAGAVTAAIAKDVYQAESARWCLRSFSPVVLICPAVAPVVGAMLLRLMSWRGVFFTQAFIGLFALAGSLLYRETLCEKQSEPYCRPSAALLPSCEILASARC
jgi:DHA1 family bicyclomycin/chloramphenicol resistance-like MFS transporter